jgi:hypothetical protein
VPDVSSHPLTLPSSPLLALNKAVGRGGGITRLRCLPPEATAKGRHQIKVAASGRHLICVMRHPRALAYTIICQRSCPYLMAEPRFYSLCKECKRPPSNARWLPMSVRRE